MEMEPYQQRPLMVTPEMRRILNKAGPLTSKGGGQKLRELYREGQHVVLSLSPSLMYLFQNRKR